MFQSHDDIPLGGGSQWSYDPHMKIIHALFTAFLLNSKYTYYVKIHV